MELITLLANPKILAALGVSGTLLLGFCYTMYKLYIHHRIKHEETLEKIEELQEKRIGEHDEMRKAYYELASDMEKTLNAVLKAIRTKKSDGN